MKERTKKQKRLSDLLLIAVLLLAAGGVWLYTTLTATPGALAVVYVDGAKKASYPLSVNRSVTIDGYNNGTNTLTIDNGYADMTNASCPDHICVESHKIHYEGESIICLPNRVVITIEGGEESGVDIF